MTYVGFIHAFDAKWGWFWWSRMLEKQNSKHKTRPAERLAPALFIPTSLLETDVLSDLRVSDEASTLPSDLCIQ